MIVKYTIRIVVFGGLLAPGVVVAYFGKHTAFFVGVAYTLAIAGLAGLFVGVYTREGSYSSVWKFNFVGSIVNVVLGLILFLAYLEISANTLREFSIFTGVLYGLLLYVIYTGVRVWAWWGYRLNHEDTI